MMHFSLFLIFLNSGWQLCGSFQLWSSPTLFPNPFYYYHYYRERSRLSSTALKSSQQRRISDPTSLFNADIDRVASAPSLKSAQHAEEMLNQMKDLYKSGSRTVRPNKNTYTIVINAYGKVIKWMKKNKSKRLTSLVALKAVVIAIALHNELWEVYFKEQQANADGVDNNSFMKPDAGSYNAVLNVLAQASGCAGDVRHSSLNSSGYESNDNNQIIYPTTCCFAEISDQILRDMHHLSNSSGTISRSDDCWDFAPNIESYEAVIQAWSSSKHPDAPARAAALLRFLEERNSSVTVTAHCYSMVIGAYAKSRISGVENAITLLSRLEEMQINSASQFKSERFRPTLQSYAPIILELVRQGQQRNKKETKYERDSIAQIQAGIKQATDFLKRAVKVYKEKSELDDVQEEAELLRLCFNTVINAWSSLPPGKTSAPQMVEKLLSELEELHEAGYKASPDTVTYNSVMKAYLKVQTGGSQYCLHLLGRMDRISKDESNVKPDVYTYSMCIDALVKSGEKGATEKADDLLQQLEYRFLQGESTLNNFMYAAVMNAYIKNGQVDAIEKVEHLLKRMKTLYESSRNELVKPDVVCYTLLINAYAQSKAVGSAEKATRILEEMEILNEMGAEKMMPNVRTYTAVVQALSTSRERNMAKKTKSIVDHMVQQYRGGKLDELPNIYTYNYLLNACANTIGDDVEEKTEALSISIETFKIILHDSRLQQNCFTYAFFLKACANLLPPSVQREELGLQAFQRCCRDGQVSDEVIFRLEQLCSKDVVIGLLRRSNTDTSAEKLPAEWTKNAK